LATPYFLFSNFISNRDLTLAKKLVACDAAFGSDTLEALYFSLAFLIMMLFLRRLKRRWNTPKSFTKPLSKRGIGNPPGIGCSTE
jgi:hypothetical protein